MTLAFNAQKYGEILDEAAGLPSGDPADSLRDLLAQIDDKRDGMLLVLAAAAVDLLKQPGAKPEQANELVAELRARLEQKGGGVAEQDLTQWQREVTDLLDRLDNFGDGKVAADLMSLLPRVAATRDPVLLAMVKAAVRSTGEAPQAGGGAPPPAAMLLVRAIEKELQLWRRMGNFIGGLLEAPCGLLLAGIIACVFVPVALLPWFPMSEGGDYHGLRVAAYAGGLGAIASVMIRISDLSRSTADEYLLFLTGLFKPAIGALTGLFVYAAYKIKLLSLPFPELKDMSELYVVVFLCFLAGFSERLGQDVAMKAAQTVQARQSGQPS